ncbi:MAG: hypothetical protein IKH01_08875 [Prevotella sp.]|nr:hypothetical protein [Prevotella sp.]
MDKNNDILQKSIDDRIDTFIRGVMTKEEELAFKQEIQADPELRAQVMATVSMIRGIREQGSAHDKAIISKYDNSRVRSVLAWACSIAAVIAIFFGYSKDKRYDELSDIVSPYYSEYSMSEYSRGDVDSATVAHLYTLFNNIKEQRNMSKIIEGLEPIYANLDSDFTYSAYVNDVAWNLALAYIKDDQTDKAINILEKLEADNPDTPIAAKASELKNKLRED